MVMVSAQLKGPQSVLLGEQASSSKAGSYQVAGIALSGQSLTALDTPESLPSEQTSGCSPPRHIPAQHQSLPLHRLLHSIGSPARTHLPQDELPAVWLASGALLGVPRALSVTLSIPIAMPVKDVTESACAI